jgi:DNA-binding winged helix-turn-helix (wHTH) protein
VRCVIFQFGDFTADVGAHELRRQDERVHLAPKAFDLLILLLRSRPRALSKADLHAGIWPRTFVSDASLAMLVAELRAALGESAHEPRFVRTVHRHGYAFQGSAIEKPASGGAQARGPWWLVGAVGRFPLSAGDNFVGRDPQAEVWLDSASVSRQHARLTVTDDRVVLEDLDSKNGTAVWGETPSGPVALKDGDEIRFGSVAVTLRRADPAASTVTGTQASGSEPPAPGNRTE